MQPLRIWFGRAKFKDWQDYATLELNLQESLAQTEDFKEVQIFGEDSLNLQENKK